MPTNPLYPNLQNPDDTVWDDLVTSLIGQRLNSVAGKVDYNFTENSLDFSSAGDIDTAADLVNWNQQYPHACVLGSGAVFKLHMHWWQEDNTRDITFTVRYRVQNNNAAKTTAWTDAVVNIRTAGIFAYSSGTLNQISPLLTLDMSSYGISATMQFKMTRTDSEGGNVVGVTFVDGHVARDSVGSRDEYVK